MFSNIIDKYYPHGSIIRDIFMRHSSQVAAKALAVAQNCHLDLDAVEIETAAMLHDIGICFTHAPSIGCNGTEPYICHGILGAQLLRQEHIPEIYARVAERHTGAGLTIDDIIDQQLPLPHVDLLPETLLERLICYADKFYSKSGDMNEKDIKSVRRSMQRHGQATYQRWLALEQEFGNLYNPCHKSH